MAAPFWQSGTLYLPGDLVQPVTAPAPNVPQVVNGGFTAGASGWDYTGGAAYSNDGHGYGGPGNVRLPGNVPDGMALNQTKLVVPAGGTLTASCMIEQGASAERATAGWVEVHWFDSSDVLMQQPDKGNVVDDGRGGAWHQSSVASVCPAGASYARAGIHLTSVADHNYPIWGDTLSVSGATAGLPQGLIYRAVQPESGLSGNSEPAWPGILGAEVIDNEVIWEAVTTSRITWTASPRYVSGATEPEWPEEMGGMVQDGTINWKAVPRRVEDEKCPNTKVVAILASKVFAADKDIVRFSATANPLDWSSADNAGYLPTGLQQANANDIAVLAPYRGNLAPMNASIFQNWQVDPDPASMALLDQMDGVGSTWPRAAVGVANDLLYLSQLGVRTIGIANAAENLAAGDVGAPIDALVQQALRVATANASKVVATWYPGAGQYWLSFSDYPPTELTVAGDVPDGLVGSVGSGAYTIWGGISPYGALTVTAGTPPPGLSIGPSGSYTYDYTAAGSYAWTVSASDTDGNVAHHDDAAMVTDPEVWFAIGLGPPNVAAIGKYKQGPWVSRSLSGIAPNFAWATAGMLHISAPNAVSYMYSTDGGITWIAPGNNGGVSASGSRMAFANGYAFMCGGTSTIKRRSLPAGAWENPTASTASRANDIVVQDGMIGIVYSTYSTFNVSTDNGETWVPRATFKPGSIAGTPTVAGNGSRIVVLYSEGVANDWPVRLKYSDDFGATFSDVVFTFPDPAIGNTGSRVIFDGEWWLACTTTGQLARSPDGENWSLVQGANVPAIQFAASYGMVMAACGAAGLLYSQDHGATWHVRASPTGVTHISGIAGIPQS